MIEKLLLEYAERFTDAFPIYAVLSNEAEVEIIIKKCLKENKKYKPKYEKDLLY